MGSSQNNLESTNKISELEGQITDLQNQINSELKLLGELIHNPKRPADFNAQLTDITQQITDLRNQILALKSQLHDLLYLNYKTS